MDGPTQHIHVQSFLAPLASHPYLRALMPVANVGAASISCNARDTSALGPVDPLLEP